MRPITLLRGVAWIGVAIVFWSLNVRWGQTADVGAGPPAQWERHVVGAGLLSFIAALALSVSGRRGNPPGWLARGIAGAASLSVLGIALLLRRDAAAQDFGHLLEGPGWIWLVAGGGLLLSATLATLAIRPAPASKRKGKARRKRR